MKRKEKPGTKNFSMMLPLEIWSKLVQKAAKKSIETGRQVTAQEILRDLAETATNE